MNSPSVRLRAVLSVIAAILFTSATAAVIVWFRGYQMPWLALWYVCTVGVCLVLGAVVGIVSTWRYWKQYRLDADLAGVDRPHRVYTASS